MNWSTDGDPTRRQIYAILSSHTISQDSLIFNVLGKCYLLDMKAGPDGQTVNFDPKHIIKRVRSHIIGNNFRIGSVCFNKSDVKSMLSETIGTTKHSIDSLLNVSDEQNVKLATEFCIRLIEACSNVDRLKSVGFKVASCATELRLLAVVLEGLLALFCYVTYSIQEQLLSVSKAAHALFVLIRVTGSKILTNQLYHDIQATFQDAFFTAAKYQIYHPDTPCYLLLNANDFLERFFGNVRMKFKHSSYDVLELINAIRGLTAVAAVLDEHPEWTRKAKHVMVRLALDYSSIQSWNSELLILNGVDICGAWNNGRAFVKTILNNTGHSSFDFIQCLSEKLTMLHPLNPNSSIGVDLTNLDSEADEADLRSYIGTRTDLISAITDDEVIATIATTSTAIPAAEDSSSSRFSGGDSLVDRVSSNNDCQVLVENKHVYKATILKEIFTNEKVSGDRLRRVQGLSQYPQAEMSEMEDSIMPGMNGF